MLSDLFASGQAKIEHRKFLLELLSPPAATTGVTGEAWLKSIPPNAKEALFVFSAAATHRIPRAAFPHLLRLAAANRLEAALSKPGTHLLEATWYAPRGNRKLKPITGSLGDLHVQIFTHPDFLYDHDQPAEEIPGRELWPNLANRQDYDAVAINPNSRGATWSPHVPALVVAGHWPGPLPLRSEAELALYLDLTGFPRQGRKTVTAANLLRVHIPPGLWSPVFTQLPSAIGPSQILCAGAMAEKLNNAERWVPGRWKSKDDADRLQARERVAWATETLALIPAKETKIPRSALRTPDGAKFLRLNPQYAQQTWIEQQLAAWRAVAEAPFPIGF